MMFNIYPEEDVHFVDFRGMFPPDTPDEYMYIQIENLHVEFEERYVFGTVWFDGFLDMEKSDLKLWFDEDWGYAVSGEQTIWYTDYTETV